MLPETLDFSKGRLSDWSVRRWPRRLEWKLRSALFVRGNTSILSSLLGTRVFSRRMEWKRKNNGNWGEIDENMEK